MKPGTFVILLLLLSMPFKSLSQVKDEPYTIEKTSFSSDRFDEFAPVWHGDGLIFSSNRGKNTIIDYSDSLNRGKIKMYYIDTISGLKWKKAKDFAREIRTKMNDGPVTINPSADTIYYSRNQIVDGKVKNLSGSRNRLGIYSSVLSEGKWNSVKEFRHNSEWYNITTPCLSPDGKRLYFASDMPDGFGGTDLYFSQWNNGYWDDPVNLGSEINTEGNESYPFINQVGELFFSSDGHPGLGGKDIFVTMMFGNGWRAPHRLDEPINSSSDDFGIVTDQLLSEGYFSSGRGKTIDIYRFMSDRLPIWFSDTQKGNQYCFSISDSGSIEIDSSRFEYEWIIGGDIKLYGNKVDYCFPGPGKYSVKLNIIDKETAKLFFSKSQYDITLVDKVQPYINCENYLLAGRTFNIDGISSFTPGYKITDYYWEFGENTYAYGAMVSHIFNYQGEYLIKLGVVLEDTITGEKTKRAVEKRIIVFNNEEERSNFLSANQPSEQTYLRLQNSNIASINIKYSAESDYSSEAVFLVELVKSKNRLDIDSDFFKNVPERYNISEVFNSYDISYSYVTNQAMRLMDTYLAYTELRAAGYLNTKVNISVLSDPAEKELQILKRRYGLQSDTYFGTGNRLITNAFLMLDQVTLLLNKYPELKLEIGVHTDNVGSASGNFIKSQNLAQELVNYLVKRGIGSNRLSPIGYGETQPAASNIGEKERRLNRRISIKIIHE